MSVTSLSAAPRTEVIELRHLSGHDLAPLLSEEAEKWNSMLEWDFAPSAELVLHFVNQHALSGYAAIVQGAVAGYAYFIAEDRKGLIGDLYVMDEWRTWERENDLLRATLNELIQICAVRRVESQLMMLDSPTFRDMPLDSHISAFPRTFMVWEPARARFAQSPGASKILLESWREERHHEAAQLISRSYEGHVDSNINDQYRSASGSRRFLLNIVQYPGCGKFFRGGSFLAFRADNGQPCGLVLSSIVSPGVGHITQICVTPDSRGWGIGYELMRQALEAMADSGCHKVSLTVTSSNESAIRLYERMGFERVREFAAHVWEGF